MKVEEKGEKRARAIVSMGLVSREGDRYKIQALSLCGKQKFYEVWKDENGKVRCNCLEFEENFSENNKFHCEHILAVKYFVRETAEDATSVTKDSASATKEPVMKEKTEASKMEKTKEISDKEVNEMKAENEEKLERKEKREVIKQEAEQAEKPFEEEAKVIDINFPKKLQLLREEVDPSLIKQREGWRDGEGHTHYVDYVEWHTVADILDEKAPDWSHSIRDIRQIGNIVVVTVAITIDGITREGIGTGLADSEVGIKKAEHDALKRAAVKFGIARHLYYKDEKNTETETVRFPANPIAKSVGDLLTSKQLGMIRMLGREIGIDVDQECQAIFGCSLDELSKRAASAFITYLQDFQRKQTEQKAHENLRKAG